MIDLHSSLYFRRDLMRYDRWLFDLKWDFVFVLMVSSFDFLQ